MSLKWPRWYPTTADDRQKDVQSLTVSDEAGCISRETALKAIAGCYDIEYADDQLISMQHPIKINEIEMDENLAEDEHESDEEKARRMSGPRRGSRQAAG